jgi:hypothetical protein
VKTVWKFPLKYETFDFDRGALVTPRGAQILTLQLQHEIPALWALVDDEQTETETRIRKANGGVA